MPQSSTEPIFVSIGELHSRTEDLIAEMAGTEQPIVVTVRGRFAALIQPLNDQELINEALAAMAARGEFNDQPNTTARTTDQVIAAVKRHYPAA